jgi:hypothetical protein
MTIAFWIVSILLIITLVAFILIMLQRDEICRYSLEQFKEIDRLKAELNNPFRVRGIEIQQGIGCIDTWECPNCHVKLVCDSSKAGQRSGNTRYIYGPCCCGLTVCSECGYNILVIVDEIKR